MGAIRNLPLLDRPREKALRYGVSKLSDIELLAIVIGSGYKDNSATEIATNLLTKYGGLSGLEEASITELKKNKGIKNVRALNIAVTFEFYKRLINKTSEQNEVIIDSEYLYNKYRHVINHATQEHLFLIILNCKKKIIYETVLSKGTSDSIQLFFEDIYRELVSHNGKYYYLVHNHTNGEHTPSKEDIMTTSILSYKSKRAKIPLLDHIIISSSGYYSFQKNEKN